MIKWKTALVELAVLVFLAGLGADLYWQRRPRPPVTAPVTTSTFDNNAARPTEAAPTPRRETVSPTRTHRHGTRPVDTSPTRSHVTRRGSPDFWVGRPRASRRSDFCKQIPAIAYNFSRETIIQAMRERGVSEAKQAKVLACLNK